jgi:hypothetical protein
MVLIQSGAKMVSTGGGARHIRPAFVEEHMHQHRSVEALVRKRVYCGPQRIGGGFSDTVAPTTAHHDIEGWPIEGSNYP